MISFEYFLEQVKDKFSFLVSDYGYSECNCQEINVIYECRFLKNDTLVCIIYSKKNDYLQVTFYKEIFQFSPTTQDGKHSLGLDDLIYRKKKRRIYSPEDYDDFMPSKIGFENSLKKISEMLLEFGSNILKGKKWKGWME
jgi:hypothetical protein